MTDVPDLPSIQHERYTLNVGPVLANKEYDSVSIAFDVQFNLFQAQVRKGNLEEASQNFLLLQANNAENEKFQAYIIELSNHIDPLLNTDRSIFFASLPGLIQSTIIDNIAIMLEKNDIFKAYQTLYDYIHYYPRHTYKYLIRAIKLLVLGTQGSMNLSKKYIRVLVTDLFPRLCKQHILLGCKDTQPSFKSIEGKHYITIPINLFEHYILLGQQYYIEHREWNELTRFTNSMLGCCGYTSLSQFGSSQSHTNKFQYMQEKRSSLQIDPSLETQNDLIAHIAFVCEFKAVAAEFIQFCNDYYRAICTLDSTCDDEKSCLIPICAIKPTERGYFDNATTTIHPEHDSPLSQEHSMERGYHNENNKRRYSFSSRSAHNKRQRMELPDRGGEGLDSCCMRGVDDALQILSKAADCMRHLVRLWNWALQTSPSAPWHDMYGDWEREFLKVIDTYRLPFDLTNAVLLVRSDMALSSPSVAGNLSKALELSQSICDRIETHRFKYKKESNRSPPEFDIPFMFAFRVLYNIGVIYLLVGSLPQSTLEVAIILSVFPIPDNLDEMDFLADELDCKTAATIFQEHEFGLMRVTQEGLVVRCIKHLIVSLDNDTSQKNSMASFDSALRWDEKAGQMIVLMQYGWNYWNNSTNFWKRIISRMREKKVFRNRVFLEFVYEPEILLTFQSLNNYNQVSLDIIPPEFAMCSGYRYFGQRNKQHVSNSPSLNFVSHIQIEENPRLIKLPSLSSITRQSILPPPSIYQSSPSNTILPSMTMSPTWYSANTQKNSQVNWMSPSFYYSRPATSVMLPKNEEAEEISSTVIINPNSQKLNVPSVTDDIIARCLEYRVHKYSSKKTPQRMRQVIQRFLKNLLMKANQDS